MNKKKLKNRTKHLSISLGGGKHFTETTEETGNDNGTEPEIYKEDLVYCSFKNATRKKGKVSNCWGCVHPFQRQKIPGVWPQMDKLYELFAENKDTMSLEDMSILISQQHEKDFFKPQYEAHLEAGTLTEEIEKGLQWLPADVLDHLQNDMPDYKIMIRQDIRETHQLVNVVKNLMIQVSPENPDEILDVDPVKVNMMIKLHESKLKQIAALRLLN